MRKFFIFLASSFAFKLFIPALAEADKQSFTIFCTGNHDATGTCLEVSNSEEYNELDCIMVPGNIIDCNNEEKGNIECILITATSAQAEFSCTQNRKGALESFETISEGEIEKQPNILDEQTIKDKTNKSNTATFDNAF